jgi:hypothetical protein
MRQLEAQLARQLDQAATSTLGQLSNGLDSAVSGFTAQLSSLTQKVDSAIPKK